MANREQPPNDREEPLPRRIGLFVGARGGEGVERGAGDEGAGALGAAEELHGVAAPALGGEGSATAGAALRVCVERRGGDREIADGGRDGAQLAVEPVDPEAA